MEMLAQKKQQLEGVGHLIEYLLRKSFIEQSFQAVMAFT